MPGQPSSPRRPGALIDFRSPADGCSPLRMAFGAPIEKLIARVLADVPRVIAQAEARAVAGAWCVGYVRYEAAAAFDAALRTHENDDTLGPLAQFLVFDAPLGGSAADDAWSAAGGERARLKWETELPRSEFDAAIAAIHDAIAHGRLYQVNYTTTISGRLAGDPLALFESLRQAQPHAYAAFIDAGNTEFVLSVSPELFFDWRDGRLLCSPMKGTAPRGHGDADDAAQRHHLLTSTKERAENVMIVDLLRSDLSRVSEPFSVRVPRLFHAEAWPTVWQLTSDVESRTRSATKLADIFKALFPCGSVTGAPKVEAMRLIHSLEPRPRGIYCGAIGVLQPGGTATFNVPIRTVTLRGEHASCGVGSGITCDATTDGEWNEWRHKRAFVERAAEPFELLETMRLSDARLVNEPRHLARMANAAVHFGFEWRDDEIRRSLDALIAKHPRGNWRVRLLSAPDGTVHTQAFALESITPPVAVQLATSPLLYADSEFVRHKTTRRRHYDAFAPVDDHVWDTLLWNERGELTEFTRANVALRIDGTWLTPALHCGLLPGIERARLLDERRLSPAVLTVDDFHRAEGIAWINSLRGWMTAKATATSRSPLPFDNPKTQRPP